MTQVLTHCSTQIDIERAKRTQKAEMFSLLKLVEEQITQ